MAAAEKPYPKKLFYRINEVAEILRVEPYVLRYWESRFPMLKPERFGNDERRYRGDDIDLLLRIRALLYDEKYTIAGAIERLKREKSGELRPEDPHRAEDLESAKAENGNLVFAVRSALADIRGELEEIHASLA